jgi:hypothetical protein
VDVATDENRSDEDEQKVFFQPAVRQSAFIHSLCAPAPQQVLQDLPGPHSRVDLQEEQHIIEMSKRDVAQRYAVLSILGSGLAVPFRPRLRLKGSGGVVYKARRKDSGLIVAIKKIPDDRCDAAGIHDPFCSSLMNACSSSDNGDRGNIGDPLSSEY